MRIPPMMPKTRRTKLWVMLLILIAILLGSLIWFVGRYEQSRFEDYLEITASNIATQIRNNFFQSAQHLQVLGDENNGDWSQAIMLTLAQQPEILRIERRDQYLQIENSFEPTPTTSHNKREIFKYFDRKNFAPDIAHTCALANKLQEAVYSGSSFVPQGDGTGYAIIDMCLPLLKRNKVTAYLVVSYSLANVLEHWAGVTPLHEQEISLRETDGSMLAQVGRATKSDNAFMAQSILRLTGTTFFVRLESWHSTPHWLANTPTVLVLILVLALIIVLGLLYRDTRKRMRTEAKLAREIIQQRKMEEMSRQSLERLQKSARLATLGEMASMLSHELNQPLAAIASYASGSLNVLDDAGATSPTPQDLHELKMALEQIASQSARAGQVIKSVHGFVRRRETERSLIAPEDLLSEVLPLLNLQAKQLEVQISLRIEPHLPLVWCDKTLIEQVIINLARNSMQAMDTPDTDPNHRLLILLAKSCAPEREGEPAQVEFQIIDQGPGLTQAVINRLFTPFFTTKDEGMGLGLSLCRTVIEQHSSSLTYTTNHLPPNTGTTFCFKLTAQNDDHH